jgi:hypothetical protein
MVRCPSRAVLAAALSACVVVSPLTLAGESAPPASAKEHQAPPIKVKPKPLGDSTRKGLAWLAGTQQVDGGWNQGEQSAAQGRAGEQIDKSNVADTCMAALALLRAGSTPKEGDYSAHLRKAADFVCGQVERSTQDGLFITDIKGTRVQTKLGQFVDTFAAALFLAEVRNTMPDDASRKRVVAALDKTMDKIEKNQKQDGRWVADHDGWAGALCQSLGHKAINRAAQLGAKVDEKVLERAEKYAVGNYDAATGGVGKGGSANVELYARASNLQSIQDSSNTNQAQKVKLEARRSESSKKAEVAQQRAETAERERRTGDAGKAREEVAQAQAEVQTVTTRLKEIDRNDAALQQAQGKVVERLNDPAFVAGFGSNGGEEFLSYMNIGESLVQKGGEEFTKWDGAMTKNLVRVQNADGSWSGQHCITGRTFCTAAALLTLTVDRSGGGDAAVAEKITH